MQFEPGEVFTINWRVIGHANEAQIGYYHQPVDVFLHYFPDTDEWVILVDEEWLRNDQGGEGSESAEYARSYIEGTVVDPDNIYQHTRIDPIED